MATGGFSTPPRGGKAPPATAPKADEVSVQINTLSGRSTTICVTPNATTLGDVQQALVHWMGGSFPRDMVALVDGAGTNFDGFGGFPFVGAAAGDNFTAVLSITRDMLYVDLAYRRK
jgi:hypothetical protein